jgi:hypothetical protein
MTMQNGFLDPSVWADFLEEPGLGMETAFFSQAPRFGRSPTQKQFYEGQFRRFQNQFLGSMGQQILGGEMPGGMPAERFADFVQNIDFDREFRSLPPSQRGAGVSRFNPRTRFITF